MTARRRTNLPHPELDGEPFLPIYLGPWKILTRGFDLRQLGATLLLAQAQFESEDGLLPDKPMVLATILGLDSVSELRQAWLRKVLALYATVPGGGRANTLITMVRERARYVSDTRAKIRKDAWAKKLSPQGSSIESTIVDTTAHTTAPTKAPTSAPSHTLNLSTAHSGEECDHDNERREAEQLNTLREKLRGRS